MNRRSKHICILLFFSFFYSISYSQVTVKAMVDRTTILVGEPIKVNLEAVVAPGTRISWFNTDTIPHFEFIERGTIDSTQDINGKVYRQQLTITSYDSGYWLLPAFILQSGKKKFRTDTFSINVTYSPADPRQDYHDIKEILEIKKPFDERLYWIIGGIVLILAALIYYFFKKRKKVAPVAIQPVSKLTPYEEAMQALEELRKESPIEPLMVKQYVSRLNDILRQYMRRKYNLSTLEKTNEELIIQLRKTRLENDDFSRLAQALRMSDFVKFAKYVPSINEREEIFNMVKTSINKLEELKKEQ